jgi:hypothetical protein
MWGKATLATLVSSTSMNVASITVMAMTQGLLSLFCRAHAKRCCIEWLVLVAVRDLPKIQAWLSHSPSVCFY